MRALTWSSARPRRWEPPSTPSAGRSGFAIMQGGRAIYFFPTDHDVSEFSQDRFGPAIDESEYLSALVRDTDTVGLKQIGDGIDLLSRHPLAHPHEVGAG